MFSDREDHERLTITRGACDYYIDFYGPAPIFVLPGREAVDLDRMHPEAFYFAEPDSLSARLMLVAQSPDPRRSGEGPCITSRTILDLLQAPGHCSDCMQQLGELAYECRTQVQACLFEFQSEQPEPIGEDDADLKRILPAKYQAAIEKERERQQRLVYIEACTAGLPPVVQLNQDGMLFPVRSWIPAGLLRDWTPLCQSVDCEPEDLIMVHTEIQPGPGSLKQFHEGLSDRGKRWYELTNASNLMVISIGGGPA